MEAIHEGTFLCFAHTTRTSISFSLTLFLSVSLSHHRACFLTALERHAVLHENQSSIAFDLESDDDDLAVEELDAADEEEDEASCAAADLAALTRFIALASAGVGAAASDATAPSACWMAANSSCENKNKKSKIVVG